MKYRTYSVKAHDREPLLRFILEAITETGCTVIRASAPNEAPFRISFETPTGERMGIIAYAFLANQKVTKNRPADEHRFQVKYGSKDGKLHELFQDPYGLYTTLFVGINPEQGFFVGADPVLHSPTKFFISVEFKQAHADLIAQHGWHCWERDTRNRENEPVEVLVGGRKSELLRYIRLERLALGEDQGHRQLLAERIEKIPMSALHAAASAMAPIDAPVPPAEVLHSLAQEFEMPERRVLDLIASARRLKMAVRGWVAEEKLVDALREVDGVTECERSDEEGGPDVVLRYRGSDRLTIQCKNVLRQVAADGTPRLDLQKTRASKRDPLSRYYRCDEFDLIAACLHAVTLRWEFRYALPSDLQTHKASRLRLANNVRIDERWSAHAKQVLDRVIGA